MRYESARTPQGNVGVSYESQELADAQAARMDKRNCYDCYDCTGCTNCYDCYDCTGCTGAFNWTKGKAKNLLSLSGLKWPVATDGQRIQIGCKNYSVEEWAAFTDAEICNMACGALEFWRAHKEIIMALANCRAALYETP